ncbi:hypothetical protein [Thiobacillus denitrificans]|uniref:Uncharacterized protein n=1 Tax=Thiobacillus denitrificans TaxID=36861 RepID=A0A106BW30_THIDE|nr:hypothetical protein [Thiobacillus denitrificans]KVW99508.1 hypothetical protein ABW22_01430 [Thiobacillus denitrificans]
MITIDIEDAEAGINIIDSTTTAGTTYFGRAHTGTSRSAAIWSVRKRFTNANGNDEFAWADGNPFFDNVWANRASLNYLGSTA